MNSMKKKQKNNFLFWLVFFLFPAAAFSETLEQYPAVIHIHTTTSSGEVSEEKILEIARSEKVPILIFTDSLLRKWEYTLWPELGPLIRKKEEQPSILKMGASSYLSKMARLQKQNSDMLIFSSLEAPPYYYWEGNPFHKNLVLKNWNRHLLVLGLDRAKQINMLPVTSNPGSFKWKWGSLTWLWPLLLFYFGWRLFFYKKEVVFSHVTIASRPHKKMGIFLMIFSLIPFGINFPFKDHRFSPMRKVSNDILPYQYFINDVLKKGGLVFWAHPEAKVDMDVSDKASVQTLPYPEMLLKTFGYHGFGFFYEGYRTVGGIGGVWDQVLMQYLNKERSAPVWAIGEVDFHEIENVIPKKLNDVETVVWLKSFNKEEVLQALREGKMYVRWSSKNGRLKLTQFELQSENGVTAQSGQTLKKSSKVKFIAAIENQNNQPATVTVRVIKNGALWKELQTNLPTQIEFEDEIASPTYYRLFIEGQYPLFLTTNPIFVEP